MRIRRIQLVIIVFLIIILPVLLIFILRTGKNVYKPLPIEGPVEITKNGDTIYHTIAPFNFTDQHKEHIDTQYLKGKIFIAHLFMTECDEACPIVTRNLKEVHEKMQDIPDFHILSISVNPEGDKGEKIINYLEHYDIEATNWHFVVGDKEEVFDWANNSLLITAGEVEENTRKFIHSDVLVLVDKENRIRGFYKGTDYQDIKKLMDEIIVLSVSYEP